MTALQRAAPAAAWKVQAASPVSNVVDFTHYAGKARRTPPGRMARIIALGYSAITTSVCLGTLLYAIGFVGGTLVPKSIDTAGGGWPTTVALCIDLQLLALVAVALSGTARRVIAAHLSPAVGYSTSMLCASLALILLFAAWQPLPALVWQVTNPQLAGAVDGVALLGWLMVFYGLYRFDRHPIHLGLIVAFWAAPTMTAGHLLFAAVATFSLFVRIGLEQREPMAALR
jgi:protein-S-isoprenylcysteine O-methyltransferase Ste14